ncbi:MAG: HAMP domain-containing protein [Nitrospirae bacterium]|nr:HAMP domain-containing protein [Nitrospirota bacterium]
MDTDKALLKDYFLRLSLKTKLTLMMLFLSLLLMTVYISLYAQTERAMYEEFEKQTAELSKAIQVGVEEVTSSGATDEKRLQTYLNKLNTKGVRELSIISNTDKIISSTDPKNIGKWITTKKKELIFKAELGEPVTGEGHAYNVIIPVVAGEKHYGYIHLTINTEDFSTFMQKRLLQRILAALLVFGIGIVFIVYLAGRYTKPIEDVVAAARAVAGGDLDHVLKTERKDEIGELTHSFNFMVRKLKEERELEERLRKAEHLAGVGQFSRSLAHEIRNPLNFISLSIDHMQEKYRPALTENSEAFNTMILNIKKEIQRVSKFAESFLEYSRPLEFEKQKTDIGLLLEDILSLVMAKAQKDGIEIVRQLDVLPQLMIDPEFIKTCIYNLILNAFQAMPGGGTLTIKTSRVDEMFCLTVEDTGTGISEELIGKIFDPFFTTKVKGLGLGLAITKRVIEEHDGRVEFRSREGKGSIVTVLLPMDKEE